MHHRLALLWVEAVEQLVRFGIGVGRVHSHVGPNLPPPGDASGVTPRVQVANYVANQVPAFT